MKKIFVVIVLGLLSHLSATARAEEPVSLTIKLSDSESSSVRDGVFIFEPLFDVNENDVPTRPPAVMNQIDKQFVPHVLVVRTGTDISFPNADNLFHHVYSFSPVKQFELKLYKEFTAEPLNFETPGVVDIGCNIHDWMLGYIIVSDSPFFGKTDDSGSIALQLPKGEYRVRFWHPMVDGESAFPTQQLVVDDATTLTWQLNAAIPVDDGFDSGFGDY
jgi:plastocyanin